LLVEDDDALRVLAQVILEALGYHVIVAANGFDALEVLRAGVRRVDLLLTDVIMPGMTGRALVDQAVALLPGLKVLFTSGYSEDAISHHGVLDPGTRFLPKPYQQKQLAHAVREALDAA
jgi:CheY-like chemotaxis protein